MQNNIIIKALCGIGWSIGGENFWEVSLCDWWRRDACLSLSNDFVKTINDLNLMTSPLTRVMDDFIGVEIEALLVVLCGMYLDTDEK